MRMLVVGLIALGALQAQETPKSPAWELIRTQHDKNGDGKVSANEYNRGAERFQRLDRDGNGFIESSDMSRASGARRGRAGARAGGATMSPAHKAARSLARLCAAEGDLPMSGITELLKLDTDGSGGLKKAELTCVSGIWRRLAMKSLDADKNAEITRAEIEQAFANADANKDGKLSIAERGSSGRITARTGAGARGGRRANLRAPAKGEVAPTFTLKTIDGEKSESLSTYKGKPVALIFGSYT